jgi:hypothetical protein
MLGMAIGLAASRFFKATGEEVCNTKSIVKPILLNRA